MRAGGKEKNPDAFTPIYDNFFQIRFPANPKKTGTAINKNGQPSRVYQKIRKNKEKEFNQHRDF